MGSGACGRDIEGLLRSVAGVSRQRVLLQDGVSPQRPDLQCLRILSTRRREGDEKKKGRLLLFVFIVFVYVYVYVYVFGGTQSGVVQSK